MRALPAAIAVASVAWLLVPPARAQEKEPPAPNEPGTQGGATAERPLREVRVRLVCDEEFRKRANWKSEAALRLTFASQVYEKEFGIRWRIADIGTWDSNDDKETLDAVLDELRSVVPAEGVDVVFGLTGQRRSRVQTTDYEFYGYADYLGRAGVARAELAVDAAGSDTGTLVHELGHLLGAWHALEDWSVMTPGRHSMPARFDAVTRETFAVTREYDFVRGIEGLGREKEEALLALYRKSHGTVRCSFSVAAAWEARGNLLAVKGTDTSREIPEVYDRAADLYVAADGEASSRGLQCRIAASRWWAYCHDLDRGRGAAEKAVEAVEVRNAPENLAGEALEQLVQVLAEQQAPHVDSVRERLLARRLDALGPGHEATLRAAEALGCVDESGVVRRVLDARQGKRIDEARWNDGTADRRVVTAERIVPDPAVREPRAPEVFERPPAGILHVRAAPEDPDFAAPDGATGEVLDVVLADASRGLRIEVLDSAAAKRSGAKPRGVVLLPSEGETLVRIGVYLRRQADALDATAGGWEIVVLARRGGDDGTVTFSARVDGPADGVLLRDRPESPLWRFAALPSSGAALRSWRWAFVGGSAPLVERDAEGNLLLAKKPLDDSACAPAWRVSIGY